MDGDEIKDGEDDVHDDERLEEANKYSSEK